MQKHTADSAPATVSVKNVTQITSIPSFKEWSKGVMIFRSEDDAENSAHTGLKLVVRDDVTDLLDSGQVHDVTLMEKVGLYLALREKKALNESRQNYLLTMKSDLLAEARDLKQRDRRAHSLRIRAIEGVFRYEPQCMYQTDPKTRNYILDADGKPIPLMGADGQPIMRPGKVREQAKDGQQEGRFLMIEDGLVTDLIREQTENLYPSLRKLNDMIMIVRKALEKEIGRPLKASLAERDDSLAAKFASLFPTT